MRTILPIFFFLTVFTTFVQSAEEVFTISAGKSYIEPWNDQDQGVRTSGQRGGRRGTSETVVKTIEKKVKSVVWYPLVKKAENAEKSGYEIFVELSLPKDKTSRLQAIVSSPEDSAVKKIEKEIELKGTDEFQKISLAQIDVKKSAYYRIEIRPVSGEEGQYAQVRNLIFEAEKAEKMEGIGAHATEHLSSPSVHLWYSQRDRMRRHFVWLYSEIQVPEGFDPMYTYYMSIGFVRGYFGIQVNSSTERRVLFSIWDSSNEAIDRNKVADEDRVQLVGKGEGVYSGSFGNEGTGGQSYWKYNWKTGQNIRFIMNARRLPGDFVAYSAWFMDNEEEGWKYMATWKAPKEKRALDGYYSFIETFGPATGQTVRKAYYGNAWGREEHGDWIEMNNVRVTHTDGKPDGRRDYEGGKADDGSNRFYMQSGGYTATKDQEHAHTEPTQTPPKVDLDALVKQVDESFRTFEQK